MDITNKEIEEKYNIKVKYILIECQECKNSWGISLWNTYLNKPNELNPSQLICRACAVKDAAKKIS